MWTPRSLSAETRHHLSLLSQCLSGAGSPYVTSGELTFPEALTLRFRDGHTVRLDPRDREAPTELIAFCAPAPFGDGTSTRYDPRIRRALQCNAEDGRFTVEGFDPAASGVLEAVRQSLCPDDPNPLHAELYAVNVYPKGGHFARHKDTPHGPDMLGTLVLCVSRNFRGGNLTLQRQGDAQRVVFQAEGFGEEMHSRWAAFFGDVDHAVEEVISGERVTLTWILHRTEGAPRAKNTRETDAFTQHLRDALCDGDFARTEDLTLGIPCTHLYAGAPGFVREVPPMDARGVLRLKGRDQHLAAVMLELGLDVALKPMLVDHGCDLQWTLARFPNAKARAVFDDERVTADAIDQAFDVEERPNDQRIAWLTHALDGYERKADREAAREFLGAPEYSDTGYFGNEGSDGEFYLHAALLAKVPVTGTAPRTRIMAALGAKAPAKTAKAARTTKTAPVPNTDAQAAPEPKKAVAAPEPKKAVAAPEPKKAVAAPEPKKTAEAKNAAPEKTATAPATPAPPKAAPTLDPKREYMASELNALGYTPATLRKALADGTLERSGFGWYRAGRGAKKSG